MPPLWHKIDHRRFIAASLIYESPGVGLIISRLKRHRSVFSLYDDLEKEVKEITAHWRGSRALHIDTPIMFQLCGGCLKIVLVNTGFTQSLTNNISISEYSNCCSAAEELSSFSDRGGRRRRESFNAPRVTCIVHRAEKKSLYVVWWSLFLLLLTNSASICL